MRDRRVWERPVLHGRQYVLGPEPFEAEPGWRTERLGPRLWLSHCPRLARTDTTDAGGMRWALLGRAVEVDPTRQRPAEAVAARATDDVDGATTGWAGRWLLVSEVAVVPDASTLLGCLHGRDAEGRTWSTSSPALLAVLVDARRPPPADERPLVYATGLSWRPPPRTGVAGGARLLPSQILDPVTGAVRPRPWLDPVEPTDLGPAGERLVANLATTVAALAAESPVHLGLTAGYDSRLVLAIAVARGLPIRTFTRVAARMSVADRLLPARLAAVAGVPHELRHRPKRGADRHGFVAAHTGAEVSEGDARPFLDGTRDDMTGIAIGGHGFAVASGYGPMPDLPSSPPPARAVLDAIGEPTGSAAGAGVGQWLAWLDEAPVRGLDWRDRFYLEQRQAGWLAAKEQLYDALAVERVPILNAAENYRLLLGIEPVDRIGSTVQAGLVEHLHPGLAGLPYNPPDRAFPAARRIITRLRLDPRWAVRAARHRLGG